LTPQLSSLPKCEIGKNEFLQNFHIFGQSEEKNSFFATAVVRAEAIQIINFGILTKSAVGLA
jgi:hypothetical protein